LDVFLVVISMRYTEEDIETYQRMGIFGFDVEERVRSDNGSDDGTNSLETLSGLETELGQARWSADGKVRVGRYFEGLIQVLVCDVRGRKCETY
jgi:hypothetical protein